MLGIYADYATTYLWLLGSITTLTFAIPLFFTLCSGRGLCCGSYRRKPDLAEYFGRCVGAFVLVVEFFIFRAAYNGTGLAFTFQMLMLVFVLMLLVHLYGAIRKIQPITETLEIGLWAFLLVVSWLCYPVCSHHE